MTDRLDENERLQHGMAQWVAERIAPIQAERDALAAKLRAVEALCAYADRTQQPRPGVLGFVAPSVVNATDIRTALSTDTTPEATEPHGPVSQPTKGSEQ